jgi:hypothetical protein
MTSPETLNMKIAVNELSIPLVTHTVYFDRWFGNYGLLKSGYSVESILDKLDIPVIDHVLRPQEARNLLRFEHGL